MKKAIVVFCMMVLLICSAVAEEGIVIFDNSDVSMIANQLEFNNDSMKLGVLLENKSDKTVMFSTDKGIAVNGMEVDDMFAVEMPPHTKKNTSIDCIGLREQGVTSVPSMILLSVRAYDNNDWAADDLANTTYTINTGSPDQAHKDVQDLSTAQIVTNNEKVTIAILGYTETFMGKRMKVYLENKTASSAMFSIEECAVNGFAIDPFWADSLMPGCAELEDIVFFTSSLEENGITQLQEIRGKIIAYDNDNWSEPRYVEETFAYTVR